MAVATALASAQNPTALGHPEDYLRADIEYGARLYAEHCDRCHGADGAGVNNVNLASGKFRTAVLDNQLRQVITSGFPAAGMPSFRFDPSELTGLVAWLRNMKSVDRGSLQAGNAARGKQIFEGRGACRSCHRVDGVGSRKAPDLSDIGLQRSAGYLERILVDPTGQLLPINRPVHIVTREGKSVDGRRLNEDTYTVQMVAEDGRPQSFVKNELREFTVSVKSAMPSYRGELTPAEMADLVAWLLSLKGQ